MIGLDNSGKSILFALLKDEDNKNTNPTMVLMAQL